MKGGVAFGGGTVACGTGILCAAGAPAMALGGVEMVAAGSVAVTSTKSILQQITEFSSERSSDGKPLTPDEQGHVDKINSTEQFIEDHPDLASEAQIINSGGNLPHDHVGEARRWVQGLKNSIDHLKSVRPYRSSEAQRLIDQAIRSAEEYIRHLEGLLATR